MHELVEGKLHRVFAIGETIVAVEAIDEPVTPIDEPETHVDEPEMQETPSDDIETPVSEIVPTDNIKVWSFDKTVIISAKAGLNYKIVDLSGRVLKTSVTESDREEVILRRNVSGIVIVRIGQKSFKIKL
ncbi:MAG: hypothetical protein IIT56_10780 [Bacteroidales bacterium]|nr:hypothetical protein [Bacteroidales bacterium]